MVNPLFSSRLYSNERRLMVELSWLYKLRFHLAKDIPAELPLWTEVPLFTIDRSDDGYDVAAFISALPAHFFRFRLTNDTQTQTLDLNSGSGSLETFWPVVQPFVDGMMGLKLVDKT